MRFAAIDIGSNSIHLIVVEIEPDGHFVVIDKAKDMVGLARKTLADGYLSDDAMKQGLRCLKSFRRVCEDHGVTDIEAVATSAMREAVNGERFAKIIRNRVGFDVRIISGEEEARLIYLGGRGHIDWSGGERRALIVDIGGGSVEFIVGSQDSAASMVSLPLGVRRLSEAFLHSDPPKKAELKRLKAHIIGSLEGLTEKRLGGEPFDFVVGSSGTLNNLALMAARRSGTETNDSHGLWVGLPYLKEMARALSGLTESERGNYHGVDPKRTDTIIAGAQLMKYILRAAGKDSYVACDFALREGLVIDYIARNKKALATATPRPKVRRRSLRHFYRRFNKMGSHPQIVRRLSLALFDQLKPLHGLNRSARGLLGASALLHDIGTAVNFENHHQHSEYLIREGDLPGFSSEERTLMALVVRHHRGPADLKSDEDYKALSKTKRREISVLASLLRIADALDRAQTDNVTEIKATVTDETVTLGLMLDVDTGLEQWAVADKAALFERIFDKKLVVETRLTAD